MKVFITGAGGLIGSYLKNYFENLDGLEIFSFKGDIRQKKNVFEQIKFIKPEIIFHLAAQSSPKVSWKKPAETFDVNVRGTIYLLEAIRKFSPQSRVFIACSSAEYGFIKPSECPIKETHHLRPLSSYGVSKVSQELLGIQYFENFKIPTFMGRFFNQIGSGQKDIFAVQSFCRQVAEIEKGLKPAIIYVGNLKPRRDFTDVRDAVQALWLLVNKGKPGEVYNICSGKAPSIRKILDIILFLTKTKIKIKVDLKRLRPSDEPLLQGDNTKIKKATGWQPKIALKKSIEDILNYWRNNV